MPPASASCGSPHQGWLAGRVVWTRIRLHAPGNHLGIEVGVVQKGAARQEIPFDPFHERLDRPLLLWCSRVTGLRAEATFAGQGQQGRRPQRPVAAVAPTGDRLHVVEDQHPRHPAQRTQTVQQAAHQRLLPHVSRETHPRPARVLESTGQKIARARGPLGERKVPYFAPVYLQVFSGQALKAQRHILDSLPVLPLQPDPSHHLAKLAATAGVGRLALTAHQLQHPHHRQIGRHPLRNLDPIDIHLRAPLPPTRPLLHRLPQGPCDRASVPPQFFGDLPLTLPSLGQYLDCTSFHLPEHPSPNPSIGLYYSGSFPGALLSRHCPAQWCTS